MTKEEEKVQNVVVVMYVLRYLYFVKLISLLFSTITASGQEGVSKIRGSSLCTAFNLTQAAGDLPHVHGVVSTT